MAIPTHDISCFSKAYKTNCPDCHDSVWFFSCTCGSKVYFEDLGWPWNQHRCKKFEVREAIEMIRNFDRYTDNEIFQIIEEYKKKHLLDISDKMWEILEYELGRRILPFKYSEVDCNPNIDFLSGQIMEINRSINFYKKFKLDKTSVFAVGMLGKLSKNDYDEIIIRENPNKNNHSNQYRAYITSKLSKKFSFKKGDRILAIVSIVSIPPSSKVWEITDMKIY